MILPLTSWNCHHHIVSSITLPTSLSPDKKKCGNRWVSMHEHAWAIRYCQYLLMSDGSGRRKCLAIWFVQSLYRSHFLTINNLSFHRKEIKSVNSGLALKFFGEHKQKACEEYVERVFREYDVDESGELSYEGTDFSEHISCLIEKNYI